MIRLLEDSSRDEEQAQAILSLLMQYCTNCSLLRVTSLMSEMMQIMPKLMSSDVIGIRRLAVMMLVEFKSRAPKEFMPHFRGFSNSQQRLIDLYCKRTVPS
jgi:hypothetical protein